MFPLLSRIALCLLLAVAPAAAQPSASLTVRRWIAAVVTRVGEAERAAAGSSRRSLSGTVGIRLRVASDGAVRDVAIEQGSGSAVLDARALAAARAAGPFRPPPPTLLTEDGTTDLSFALAMTGSR